MRLFLQMISRNIFLIIIIVFFGFLFFYRLDWPTLGSWDEAWYGSISREMVKSGDVFGLVWNGLPYYDHPPMGFWLIALSYKVFGISEFSTRFPSAVLGLMSMILMYLIGVKLSKEKLVGFSAAMILGTCVWYVLRVRSGNLDSPFVFFYVLTIYLSLKTSQNIKWFPFLMLAFGALMLTKTLVGASALLVIVWILFKQIIRFRSNFKWIILGFISFAVLVFPWYWLSYIHYSDFIKHHFFEIGTRKKSFSSYLNLQYELPLFYLHMGIRKWYYLWLASFSYFIVSFRFIKKNIFTLLFWNVVILYPFLTTDQTQIWHLIPVYSVVALIVSWGILDGGLLLLKIVNKWEFSYIKKYNHLIHIGVKSIYLLFILFIVSLQVKIFYNEVIPQSKYISDDVDISMRVSQYPVNIFLDDDYLPLAVFYSGRTMRQMSFELEDRHTLVNLFKTEKSEPFVAITRNWALNNLKENNIEYEVLEHNNSFSIVKKP